MTRLKKIQLLISVAVMIITGCQTSTLDRDNGNIDKKIITENITESLSFDHVSEIPIGESLYLFLNRTGTLVGKYEVELRGTMTESGEHLIVAKVKDSTLTIGNGDSGSPLVTKDGKIAGALCYGFPGDSKLFIARAIDDVNNLPLPPATRSNTAYMTLGLSNTLSGITENDYLKFSERFKSRGSEKVKDIHFVTSPIDGDMKRSVSEINSEDPIAGMSIEVSEVRGDVVNFGAVGTISSVSDGAVRAFGHAYQNMGVDIGRKPVFISSMLSMVNTGSKTFKLSKSTDKYVGALVNDALQGIVINPNLIAATVPMDFTIKLLPEDNSLNNLVDFRQYNHHISENKGDNFLIGLITFSSSQHFFNGGNPDVTHDTKITLQLGDLSFVRSIKSDTCFYSEEKQLLADDLFSLSYDILDEVNAILWENSMKYNEITNVSIESTIRKQENMRTSECY